MEPENEPINTPPPHVVLGWLAGITLALALLWQPVGFLVGSGAGLVERGYEFTDPPDCSMEYGIQSVPMHEIRGPYDSGFRYTEVCK